MTRNRIRRLLLGALLTITAGTSCSSATPGANVIQSSLGPLQIDTLAEGLDQPWSLAFLPDGRMLLTERPGKLRIVALDGQISAPVTGVPAVHHVGQGGLLDVALDPAFASNRRIYLSYAESGTDGSRTAVMRARLDLDMLQLDAQQRIFGQQQAGSGGNHWGSRLAFAPDGKLFVTLGDRGDYRDLAQDLSTHYGKVVRIDTDGRPPADNPFVGQTGALPEIWSYGHRNLQGATIHPDTGVLWTHEHGPQGGDEVNRTLGGRNYGWPRITYGREYGSGAVIGEGTQAPDVEAPLWQWTPSIAPSGMSFLTDARWGAWRGQLLVGALAGRRLIRLRPDAQSLTEAERLLGELDVRIRDVRQGPDGAVYLLDESQGRLLRLRPPG